MDILLLCENMKKDHDLFKNNFLNLIYSQGWIINYLKKINLTPEQLYKNFEKKNFSENKMTTVINVRKKELQKSGFSDFKDWSSHENHVYIGRNMSFYVPGTFKSKWANPFSVKKYGRDKCLQMYEEYIKSTPELFSSLHELQGKVLGCWCHPEPCHGDILIKLLREV